MTEPAHLRNETPSTPTATTDAARCPNCDMARSEWLGSNHTGYAAGGADYCCRGCAEGTGCVCREPNQGGLDVPESLKDASATLMSPRDPNGRPLDPEEFTDATQLRETAGRSRPPETGSEASRWVESTR
jgi:hypothetical protein